MASLSTGTPMPGGYWLCPASIAAIAACFTASGPSASGKPWPRLIEPLATASADISAKIVVPNSCRRRFRYGFTTTPIVRTRIAARGRRAGERDQRGDREQDREAERDDVADLVGRL